MQNLLESHSLAKHQNAAWRHMQLCRQNKKGEMFIARIEPSYNDLDEKGSILKQANKNRVAANDTVRLKDLFLDDELRKLHNRAKEYDREHPGQHVATMLFPKGKITPIVSMSNNAQPEKVSQIIKKLKSLGSDHELYSFVKTISNGVSDCNNALKAYGESIEIANSAKTDVELSKANLRRQYTASYFEAAGLYGKNYAERLFPILYKNKTTVEPEVEQETMDTEV
jgi:hypothetical protein